MHGPAQHPALRRKPLACTSQFFSLVSTLAISIFARQAFAEESAPLVTDRPGNAMASSVVAHRTTQFEISYNHAFAGFVKPVLQAASLPSAVRFGVLPRIEARLSSAIVSVANDEKNHLRSNAAPIGLGFKAALIQQHARLPNLALVWDTYLPTSEAFARSHYVASDARLSTSFSLPKNFGLLLNAGAIVAGRDASGSDGVEDQVQLSPLYVVNVNYVVPALSQRLSVFVESYGTISTYSSTETVVQIDAGAAFLLTKDWQLDFYTQVGVSDAATPLQLALGLSTRI